MPFFRDLEEMYACSVGPCRPVNNRCVCVFLLFFPPDNSQFFFAVGYVGLKESQIIGV